MVKKQEITMVLNVDLQCTRCCKKVKKVLCKFPQIQDQVYDKEQNTLTIKVACVCPEKIKSAIITKGGKAIKGIDIVKPEPTVNPPTQPPVNKDPETEIPSGAATADNNAKGQGEEDDRKRPIHIHCVVCYREGGGRPCLHGSGCHPPLWPFYSEPYCDGYGGRRPVGYECHVAQWEICPQENYGPCSIM